MLMGKRTIGSVGVMAGVHSVPEPFCWSLVQMIQYCNEYVCAPGEVIHLIKADHSFHASARNGLVKDMMGDWLLQLDTDHLFAPDLIARLLCVMNSYPSVEVLSALYMKKIPPYEPCAYMFANTGVGFMNMGAWGDARIFEVDGVGAGCLLVKKSVFERIYEELDEEPFSIIQGFGEDLSFFKRLKKLGIKTFVAPQIECHHLALKPIMAEDFTRNFGPSHPIMEPTRDVEAYQ